MPRLISFSMTVDQVRARTKTVTRRLGWRDIKPGTVLCAVEKAMGLKPGEQVKRLGLIRVVDVRRERLLRIAPGDVAREGYPGESRGWFIDKFCAAMRCSPFDEVTRIEFEYLDKADAEAAR